MVQRPAINELMQSIQVKGQSQQAALSTQQSALVPKMMETQKTIKALNTGESVINTFSQIGVSIYQQYRKNKDQTDMSAGTTALEKALGEMATKFNDDINNNKLSIDEQNQVVVSEDLQDLYNTMNENINSSDYSKTVKDSLLESLEKNFNNYKNQAANDILTKQFNDDVALKKDLLEKAVLQDSADLGGKGFKNSMSVIDSMDYLSDTQRNLLIGSMQEEVNYNRANNEYQESVIGEGLTDTFEKIMKDDRIPKEYKNNARQEAQQAYNDRVSQGSQFLSETITSANEDPTMNFSIGGTNFMKFDQLKVTLDDYIEKNGFGTDATNALYQQLESVQANAIISSPLIKTSSEKTLMTDIELSTNDNFIKNLKDSGSIVSFDNPNYQSVMDIENTFSTYYAETSKILTDRSVKRNKEVLALAEAEAKKIKLQNETYENLKETYTTSLDNNLTSITNDIETNKISGEQAINIVKQLIPLEIPEEDLALLTSDQQRGLNQVLNNYYTTKTIDLIDRILSADNKNPLTSDSPVIFKSSLPSLQVFMDKFAITLSEKDLKPDEEKAIMTKINDFMFNRFMEFRETDSPLTEKTFLDQLKVDTMDYFTAMDYDKFGMFKTDEGAVKSIIREDAPIYFNKELGGWNFASEGLESRYKRAETGMYNILGEMGISIKQDAPMQPKVNSDGTYSAIPTLQGTDGRFFTLSEDLKHIQVLNDDNTDWVDLPQFNVFSNEKEGKTIVDKYINSYNDGDKEVPTSVSERYLNQENLDYYKDKEFSPLIKIILSSIAEFNK